MIKIRLKDFFEEIKKRNIDITSNNEPMFYRFSQLKKLIDQNKKEQVNEGQIDIKLNIPIQQKFKTHFTQKQIEQIEPEIKQELIIKQKNQSDTDSISLVVDHNPQIRFMDSLQWHQLFGENEKNFKPAKFNNYYFKIQKLDENNQFDLFSNIIIDKGNNTLIFSGFNLLDDCQIAIKETTLNRDFVEQSQQYLLHAEIYELYPNVFLKIFLPVFIQSIAKDQLLFQSQMELGEINLFQYSQQQLISDNEYQLIHQQLYNQIMLLHKHQIAHRDIKPQNIIFVKNKGWLLCDFGEAIKYSQQISVYNIRGTFGFIPSKIYQASKLGDVLIKQDLLYNDLYALGVTLLIIKHQIKKSTDIEQFMDKQDNIIEQLLSNPNPILDKFYVPKEIVYIKPILEKQKQNDSQLSRVEINEYVNILKFVNNRISPSYITYIINSIEEFLKKSKEQNEKLYLSNCKNLYFCTRYIKRFKNIPSLKTLKSTKFWRPNFRKNDLKLQEISIVFMYQLGFVDLVLKYGSQILSNTYSFTIHLIMIRLFILLQEQQRALYEYQLVLIFREQYFMSEDDLKFFIEISVFMMDCKLIAESELNVIKEDVGAARIDISKMDLNFNDTDEEICFQFLQQCQPYQNGANDYWFDQVMTQNAKQQIDESYRLSLSDKLNDRIFEIHKYSCPSFLYQNYLKDSYISKILLSTNQSQSLKKIRKKMNYLLIYNSESEHQFQINNLLKLSLVVFKRLNNQLYKERVYKKVSKLIQEFKKLPQQCYKLGQLYELRNTLIFIFQNQVIEPRLIKIAILFYKNVVKYALETLSQIEMFPIVHIIFEIFKKSKSLRRIRNLNWYQKITVNQNFNNKLKLKLEAKTKQINNLYGRDQKLYKRILLEQFLAREY